jgi:ribose transport system permease protein
MKLRISTRLMRKLVTVGLVLILMLVFSLKTKNFLTLYNFSELSFNAALLGLLALGLSFVMIGGGIDLSVGGIVCAVAILCSRFSFLGTPGWVVILFGILCGALFGLCNGLLVTWVRLTEFVTTLATGILYQGLGLLFAFRDTGKLSGTLISKGITNKSYLSLGGRFSALFGATGPLKDFHLMTVFWIVLAVVMYFILRRTNFGLHTYAIGSQPKAAEMSGVNTKRVKAIGFIISGAFAGLAAAFLVANMSAANASLGNGYEFQAIAACVVGGVALGGGKGDAVCALLGSIFLVTILNGLYKFNIPTYWSYILQGVIIIVATVFDASFASFTRRLREKRAERAGGGKGAAVHAGE